MFFIFQVGILLYFRNFTNKNNFYDALSLCGVNSSKSLIASQGRSGDWSSPPDHIHFISAQVRETETRDNTVTTVSYLTWIFYQFLVKWSWHFLYPTNIKVALFCFLADQLRSRETSIITLVILVLELIL